MNDRDTLIEQSVTQSAMKYFNGTRLNEIMMSKIIMPPNVGAIFRQMATGSGAAHWDFFLHSTEF